MLCESYLRYLNLGEGLGGRVKISLHNDIFLRSQQNSTQIMGFLEKDLFWYNSTFVRVPTQAVRSHQIPDCKHSG